MKEIFERRSIRSYTDEPVSAEHLDKLLRAAMQAPSASNTQPWHFITITNRETMLKIVEAKEYANMLKDAPLAIVVCGDRHAHKLRYEFWVQDCSAATQNILLEAQYLGLGAVWLGVHPVTDWVENISAILGLPENIVPLGIVSVGHPKLKIGPVDRFNPDKIHNENW